jgi:hypothetical protein
LEKIKHGFNTLAECGGIRGVDDTSSLKFIFASLLDIAGPRKLFWVHQIEKNRS